MLQLNRGEGRHSLGRTVFHGKRGELRQRYHEGHEDQLGALGLVMTIIVLWNTIYMDAALNQPRQDSFPVREEDEARLSPLVHDHINMMGRLPLLFRRPSPVESYVHYGILTIMTDAYLNFLFHYPQTPIISRFRYNQRIKCCTHYLPKTFLTSPIFS